MRPRLVLALSLPLALVLLAGCTGTMVQPLQATSVPETAPTVVGEGDFEVNVKVVSESGAGEAIVGAPVVIYPIDKPAQAPTIHQLLAKNATMGGRTGADGFLRAYLNKGGTYTFITAVPNNTTEARHLVKVNDDLREKPLVITVYRTAKAAQLTGSVPTTAKLDFPVVQVNNGAVPVWFPGDTKFHEDAGSNRQYIHRLETATVKLTYTVGPGEWAELGVRAGFIPEGQKEPKIYWERPYRFPSGATNLFGPIEVTLRLEAPQLAWGDTMKNPSFAVGPMTQQGVLAPSGIKYVVDVDATFTTSPVPMGPKPYDPYYASGLGTVGLIAALVLASLSWSGYIRRFQ